MKPWKQLALLSDSVRLTMIANRLQLASRVPQRGVYQKLYFQGLRLRQQERS